MIKQITLFFVLSQFVFMSFESDQAVMRAIYFISLDLFLIAFFLNLLHIEKRLMSAAMCFMIGRLICDILLFTGMGDVSKWYYMTFLFICTLIGYFYGGIIYDLKLSKS